MLREFISGRAVFVALAAAALIAAFIAATPVRRDMPAMPALSGAAEVPLAQAYGP